MDDVRQYYPETFAIQPENFLHGVKCRRSIRNFKHRKLERECLERILQAGRYTPTAKNQQACRFIVLQEELDVFKDLLWQRVPEMADEMQEKMHHSARPFKVLYRR